MKYLKKYSSFIIIIILLFYAFQPLLTSGFFPIHDDEQVGRLYDLDQSLKAGNFPVKIAQHLGFGYGYPLFNFYPSFVYYLAEVFVLLGFGYITSIKLMIGIGFVLAAIFMYIFSKEYFGKIGGIVSAVAYTYVPYHAVDIYVRGAIPEFWSFVYLPAIFLFYKKLSDTKQNRYVYYAGLALAGLIFTHNLIAMMSGFIIGIYLVFLLFTIKDKKSFIIQVLLSGLLGLCLSAAFWIPSFFERQYTMIELLTKELADYNQHFVYFRQLWDSPWGYGGSLYGLYDGLSFEIGKVHILGAVLAFIVSIYLIIKKDSRWRIVILFFLFFISAAFMTTFRSKAVWDLLIFFSYIQFPWRFLLFTAFTSSFLLGGVVLFTKSKNMQIITGIILVAATIFFYKDYFKPEKYLTQVTDNDYIKDDVIKWRTSIMAFEYVPKGVATKISKDKTTIIDINKNEVAKSSFTLVKGDMKVSEQTIKPQYKKFQIIGRGGILRVNTYAVPGWKVFIDGKEATYTDKNKFKLIDVAIPRGSHIIEAKFTNTIYSTIGNTLTLTGVFILLAGIISSRRNEKHKK